MATLQSESNIDAEFVTVQLHHGYAKGCYSYFFHCDAVVCFSTKAQHDYTDGFHRLDKAVRAIILVIAHNHCTHCAQ